jgi:hypothetical protein
VARVLGFSASINAFYVQFGSVCKAGANTLTLTLNNLECLSTVTTGPGAVVNSKPIELAMSFCVLTSVGVSVTVQNFVVNENCSMEFANMTYTGS